MILKHRHYLFFTKIMEKRNDINNDNVSWEISKENVQPLRTGRCAASLNAALQPSQEHSQSLLKQRQKFEKEILAGENGLDPLDPWDRYLKWTQQNFPIGENKLRFESILRKLVSKFLKFSNYKNDPRYVNAWIMLAELSSDPENIFSYMKSEGFGTSCAAFYIAWADEYEKYGNVKKASLVYELGEENSAEPLHLLLKMKHAFEMRSAREIFKTVDKEQKSPDTTRKVLTNLSDTRKITLSVLKNQSEFGKTSNRKSLAIFNDTKDCSSVVGEGKWATVPDHIKANKENNLLKPTNWKNPHVTRYSRMSRPQTTLHNASSFQIFDDSVSTSGLTCPPSARKVSQTVERVLTEAKQLPQSDSIQQMLFETINEDNAKVVRQYPVDKVYSALGEFQLEEIIALEQKKK